MKTLQPTEKRQVPLLDLAGEYSLFKTKILSAVEEIFESQQFIGGPAIAQFEEKLAARLEVKHAIAISSGTDAILCSLMALGIGPGDEVIVPSFTFFATAGCVTRVGAKPVFVDIDPRTFNLDPSKLESARTPRTRAIIPVHLFGQCADMDPILEFASTYKLFVIEDAAQAIGAKYKNRHAGGIGHLGCLSFYPTKNLGCFGEGGMILSNNTHLATIVRQLRTHGESKRYYHDRVGGNFRLDTMKAAILSIKLDYLDRFTAHRRHNAALYDLLLADSGVTTPHVPPHQDHVYHQYSILCDNRDGLRSFLSDRGIASAIYYPVPLHQQKCFAPLLDKPVSLHVTEQTCSRILSLPVHPMLTDEDVQYVASCLNQFRN